MSDVKKIATREGYGKALVELGALHPEIVVLDADLAGATKTSMFRDAYPDRFIECGIAEANMMDVAAGLALHPEIVVLDADLAGATKTSMFRDAYPDRFIECGIAEANMMDVAAGLSTLGFVPFASSFAMFAAGRAYDMVRNSIGYPGLNVKVCASHGGISVGEDGASHQMNEDFALMRVIPGMTVMCPSDFVEAQKMVKAAYELDGPVYIRFGRAATPIIHGEDFDFRIGQAEMLQDGSDVTLIATGIVVPEAMEAAKTLAKEGISARVLNMATIKPLDKEAVIKAAQETGHIVTVEEHSIIGGLGEAVASVLAEEVNMATIKPLDKEAVIKAAQETGHIVTVEEHSIIGGLGEAVASVLAEEAPARLHRIGVRDVFGHSGPAAVLLHEFGLDAEGIAKETRRFLEKQK